MNRGWYIVGVLAVVFPVGAMAQSDGCGEEYAYARLDINNVAAAVNNAGVLHRGSQYGYGMYEIPQASGIRASFNTDLLFAGMVDSEVRVSKTRYDLSEFWPGPYQYLPADAEACEAYNRMYSVYQHELESGNLTRDIIDWPWELGAPVVDGDGNPDNYDPGAGDRPEIFGDQSIWWLMNDGAGRHTINGTEPLGLEIRATAFAWNVPRTVLENTTFYRYRVRNVSDQVIHDAFTGLLIDVDLGTAHDDFMGSDSTLGLSFFYNADNDDEGNYGENPPAIGYTYIRGPQRQISTAGACVSDPNDHLRMTSNFWEHEDIDIHYRDGLYNVLQGLHGQGLTMYDWGIAWKGRNDEGVPTKWSFAGDPVSHMGWNMNNPQGGNHTFMSPHDVRSATGMGPFCLNPGEETEFVLAIVWSRGSSNLDSVRQLMKDVAIIRKSPEVWLSSRSTPKEEPVPEPDYPLGLNGVYPNPASNRAIIQFSLPQSMHVRLEVFDVLGRRVHDSGDEVREAGQYRTPLDVSEWVPGIYLARIQLDHISESRQFVVAH